MNATGHEQSKSRPMGVTITLHGTRYVHASMNLRKMKFVSYLDFHMLFRNSMSNFGLPLCFAFSIDNIYYNLDDNEERQQNEEKTELISYCDIVFDLYIKILFAR